MQKRLGILALLLLALMSVLPTVLAQETELPDLEGREITIAVENAYPPYNYINEDGETVGWDYDTFNDICDLINCVPVFVEAAWDGMLVAIANGEYDVAADGITYTEDRDETVDFSSLYQAYDETFLVRSDEDRFTNAEELGTLADYLVGTQIGTTNEITALSLYPAENVNSFDTFGAAVQALLNGDVDAVLVDRPAAEGYLDAQEGLAVLETSIGIEHGLAFAFTSGSDLVEPINAAMAALQASGRWDQIFTRWFAQAELPDLEGREVTIAVENAYPPYNYINEDGETVGWDYDTFNEICERLNCTPVFVEAAWDGMLVAIANGEYDVAADGITYTEDRDETVDFSSLYQAYDETFLVRGDEDRFTNAEELGTLDDFLVGTQIGTTNEITALSLYPAENVNSFDTFGAAVQALLNGDVDAVLVDRPAAEGYIEAQAGLAVLETSIGIEHGLAFAYPSGSDLVEPINAAMAALQADGTWDDIYRTWFESE